MTREEFKKLEEKYNNTNQLIDKINKCKEKIDILNQLIEGGYPVDPHYKSTYPIKTTKLTVDYDCGQRSLTDIKRGMRTMSIDVPDDILTEILKVFRNNYEIKLHYLELQLTNIE